MHVARATGEERANVSVAGRRRGRRQGAAECQQCSGRARKKKRRNKGKMENDGPRAGRGCAPYPSVFRNEVGRVVVRKSCDDGRELVGWIICTAALVSGTATAQQEGVREHEECRGTRCMAWGRKICSRETRFGEGGWKNERTPHKTDGTWQAAQEDVRIVWGMHCAVAMAP